MSKPTPSLPEGLRVYAIGDVHGRLDLLMELREKIAEDAKDSSAKIQTIMLGDYIDRGLHNRETIDYLIDWQAEESAPPILLMGNHEVIMRSVLDHRDTAMLERWLQFGGLETLLSYGVKPASLVNSRDILIEELADKTPQEHRNFLQKLPLFVTFGDYYFCHAGVNPDVKLAAQKEEDLLWIRHRFLGHHNNYEKMIVHGHSISLEAEFRSNRIGIDTGAYATGKLTALGLEGTKQWLIQTG